MIYFLHTRYMVKSLTTHFTLDNCLLGAMKLTKNADPDKYGYKDYGIGFDACSQFSFPDGSWGKDVIIFGVDNSFSVHVDNNKKDVLLLAEGQDKD